MPFRQVASITQWDATLETETAVSPAATVVELGSASRAITQIEVNLPDGGGTPQPTTERWAGHQPGRIYLGMNTPADTFVADLAAINRPIGVRRWFIGSITDTPSRAVSESNICASRGQIMWMSVGGLTDAAGWTAIANGTYDSQLRAWARDLSALSQPVIFTYAHEASYDGTDAEGPLWAAAFVHIYDTFRTEVQSLGYTDLRDAGLAVAPIQGEWLWNPKNLADDPDAWMRPELLAAIKDNYGFVGVDFYHAENQDAGPEKLGRIQDWLASKGYGDLMIGIGESGGTSASYPSWNKTGAEWWREFWQYVSTRTSKFGVVSYFNDARNSKEHVYWPLDEAGVAERGEAVDEKMQAYRESLDGPISTTLDEYGG